MQKILIVEDEIQLAFGLKDNLELEGYQVEVANNGLEGYEQLTKSQFDLVLLDVMLPGMSGFEILKRIRQLGNVTPVIMVTAKSDEIDKVLGLELGADDYMTKPFSLRELFARVKAVLRRQSGSPISVTTPVTIGILTVDFANYTANHNGESVAMTPKEIEVLKFLWERKNQTVSRDELLTQVWGYDETISSRTVDNFILKIRQKMEEDSAHPKHIITIHGVGYKLIP
ncbi:MAG: response regulator transcription factor [Bacteroidetes bacterium]|nr:response regulator transcription factor [Bacteroidota bacterium]